jgi:hypothetical protein
MKYAVKVEYEVMVETNDKHSAIVKVNRWLGFAPGHATAARELPFDSNTKEYDLV